MNKIATEKLSDIPFYGLEKAIKTYRQFAQRNISKAGLDITIDQWLILKTLQENPEVTQQELAVTVFKDFASVTRMIELLVNKGYLTRSLHATDRRRFCLTITEAGCNIIETLQPLILSNRETALAGIPAENITRLNRILHQIILNCQP
jgi:MarR family transcriptional regulator for hemolysin